MAKVIVSNNKIVLISLFMISDRSLSIEIWVVDYTVYLSIFLYNSCHEFDDYAFELCRFVKWHESSGN
jgi:hypothetical protein